MSAWPNFDGVLVILAPQALTEPMTVAKVLVAAMHGRQYPIFASWMGGKSVGEAIEYLNESSIPTFATPERAVRAFLYMVAFAANQELLLEAPPKVSRDMAFDHDTAKNILAGATRHGFLPESEVWQLFAAYNLPIVQTAFAASEEQAVKLSRDIGYPVVLKLFSSDISHKTDAGGVHLDLRCDADVGKAYQQILQSASAYRPGSKIEGVSIQPYLANPDFEILMGGKTGCGFWSGTPVRDGRNLH